MRPIVADGVGRIAWSVCRSVCRYVGHDGEPSKNSWTDRDAVSDVDWGGPKKSCIRWGSKSPHVKRQFWWRNGAGPGHARTCPAVDILKATHQWAAPARFRCRWGVLDPGAHWRHLANTTELSVCGGDATLCQIISLVSISRSGSCSSPLQLVSCSWSHNRQSLLLVSLLLVCLLI